MRKQFKFNMKREAPWCGIRLKNNRGFEELENATIALMLDEFDGFVCFYL